MVTSAKRLEQMAMATVCLVWIFVTMARNDGFNG